MKPEHKNISISGTVSAVFAHRFVIESMDGKFLADLGPEGVDLVRLQQGDKVTVKGERKPSEIKVTEIAKGDGEPISLEHKKKHEHDDNRDPRDALAAVAHEGFVVVGEARRKPKHFEILGRSAKGKLSEFHVEFDGTIRKHKPIEADDDKWAPELPGG